MINNPKSNSGQSGIVTNEPVQPESSVIISVIEESLNIQKQIVETGKVNISKKIIEEDFDANLPVFKEEVIVERKPIGKYFDGDLPGVRFDGDTTIIPVIKEVIVKRMLLVEELHITKRTIEQTVPIHEVLRKVEVTIKRNDSHGSVTDQVKQ